MINVIIFPVKDLDQVKTLYGTLLGVEPYVDEPYYVGFRVDGQEIGLDPNGHDKGMTGPVGYMEVDDIQKHIDDLVEAGAEVVQEATDVGGGKLIARLKDVDDNPIGLAQSP